MATAPMVLLNIPFLKEKGVRTLLVSKETGLCNATRMALADAHIQNYEGIVIVDGNGQDGIEALPEFLAALDEGYDLVQGSRFMKGGFHKNTPPNRYLGIRYIFARRFCRLLVDSFSLIQHLHSKR
jgi:dolichol-phosphate mannosyltransferase